MGMKVLGGGERNGSQSRVWPFNTAGRGGGGRVKKYPGSGVQAFRKGELACRLEDKAKWRTGPANPQGLNGMLPLWGEENAPSLVGIVALR